MNENISPCCAVTRSVLSGVVPASDSSHLFEHASGGTKKEAVITGAEFVSSDVNTSAYHSQHNDDFVALSGGVFLMGSMNPDTFAADGEGPIREVALRPFHISATAVTNEQFARFVDATGYITEAERFGWSYVFHLFVEPDIALVSERIPGLPWWIAVHGADWAHPEGPGSGIADRMDHPVAHVSWHDATAFCEWSGTRLPTEAEWEYAARGGLVQNTYAWGNSLHPDGKHMCNIWQGKFPDVNHPLDGFLGTAPVTAFEPNGYGLYNVCGSVWEWCSDWFSADHHQNQVKKGRPIVDPKGPLHGDGRVMKGGSYLCHRSYCNRYRVSARSHNTPDSSTGHMGFRVARDA